MVILLRLQVLLRQLHRVWFSSVCSFSPHFYRYPFFESFSGYPSLQSVNNSSLSYSSPFFASFIWYSSLQSAGIYYTISSGINLFSRWVFLRQRHRISFFSIWGYFCTLLRISSLWQLHRVSPSAVCRYFFESFSHFHSLQSAGIACHSYGSPVFDSFIGYPFLPSAGFYLTTSWGILLFSLRVFLHTLRAFLSSAVSSSILFSFWIFLHTLTLLLSLPASPGILLFSLRLFLRQLQWISFSSVFGYFFDSFIEYLFFHTVDMFSLFYFLSCFASFTRHPSLQSSGIFSTAISGLSDPSLKSAGIYFTDSSGFSLSSMRVFIWQLHRVSFSSICGSFFKHLLLSFPQLHRLFFSPVCVCFFFSPGYAK